MKGENIFLVKCVKYILIEAEHYTITNDALHVNNGTHEKDCLYVIIKTFTTGNKMECGVKFQPASYIFLNLKTYLRKLAFLGILDYLYHYILIRHIYYTFIEYLCIVY